MRKKIKIIKNFVFYIRPHLGVNYVFLHYFPLLPLRNMKDKYDLDESFTSLPAKWQRLIEKKLSFGFAFDAIKAAARRTLWGEFKAAARGSIELLVPTVFVMAVCFVMLFGLILPFYRFTLWSLGLL